MTSYAAINGDLMEEGRERKQSPLRWMLPALAIGCALGLAARYSFAQSTASDASEMELKSLRGKMMCFPDQYTGKYVGMAKGDFSFPGQDFTAPATETSINSVMVHTRDSKIDMMGWSVAYNNRADNATGFSLVSFAYKSGDGLVLTTDLSTGECTAFNYTAESMPELADSYSTQACSSGYILYTPNFVDSSETSEEQKLHQYHGEVPSSSGSVGEFFDQTAYFVLHRGGNTHHDYAIGELSYYQLIELGAAQEETGNVAFSLFLTSSEHEADCTDFVPTSPCYTAEGDEIAVPAFSGCGKRHHNN